MKKLILLLLICFFCNLLPFKSLGMFGDSDEDHYATYLNEKGIQERRIEKSINNVYFLMEKSTEEIKNLMHIVSPVITTEKKHVTHYNDTLHENFQPVDGHLSVKITRAMAEISEEDRQHVIKIVSGLYYTSEGDIYPDASFPHVVKVIADIPFERRDSVINFSKPFFKLYFEDSYRFSNKYPSLMIKAIANIPEEELSDVMKQAHVIFKFNLPRFTKDCYFESYSDGGDNGKTKNEHAEIIKLLGEVSESERQDLIDHTFKSDISLFKAKESKIKKISGRFKTEIFRPSYPDVEGALLNIMQAMKNIPKEARGDFVKKVKLLHKDVDQTNHMGRSDYVQTIEAFSRFYPEEIDALIVDALTYDFDSYVVNEISKIDQNQRKSVMKNFASIFNQLTIKNNYQHGQIISTLGKIKADEREDVIHHSTIWFLMEQDNKKDQHLSDFSLILEILSKIPTDERNEAISYVRELFDIKVLVVSDRVPHFIQALFEVSKEKRKMVLDLVTSPFLIDLQKSGYSCGYQTPWGNSISNSFFSGLIKLFSQIEYEKSIHIIEKSKILVSKNIYLSDYTEILEVLAKIPENQIDNIIVNTLLFSKNKDDRIKLKVIKALSYIPQDYYKIITSNFENLSQKTDNIDAIIEALVKYPLDDVQSIIDCLIPLFEINYNKSRPWVIHKDSELLIIQAVGSVKKEERASILKQTINLSKGLQDSTQWTIKPVNGGVLKIEMPTHPELVIFNSLAKVKKSERDDLVKLVNQFYASEIKKIGKGYMALVIKEMASVGLEERHNNSNIVSSFGDKRKYFGDFFKGSKESFQKGFDVYIDYLLGSTFCELFRLQILSATSFFPTEHKIKLSMIEPILTHISESDVGYFIIGLGKKYQIVDEL